MTGAAVATKSPQGTSPATPRTLPPWVALLLVLILAALLAWREETSLDFGFHLATGRYILEHRAWPETDPFTYTVTDHPYIDMHGLVQVAIALAERAGGLAGVGLLRAAFVLATTGVLFAHARRRGVHSPALLVFGFTLALFAWEQRFFARPEMATYLFLAIELYLLRRHAEDGRSRWLYAIPALQVVWVWSHALSLFGPAVLGLYALSTLFTPRRRTWAPWIALGLGLLALLANPYGARGVLFLWELRTRLESTNEFAGSISELSSPFAKGTPALLSFLAFKTFAVLGVLAVLAAGPRRLGVFDVALVLVFGALAATAVRNIGLFVVASLPVFVDAAEQALRRIAPPARGRPRRSWKARWARYAPGAGLAVALVIWLVGSSGVLTGAYVIRDRRPGQLGSGYCPGTYPLGTVDFMVANGLRGPIYNHLNFGGYLIGRLWPEEKVYVDGRLEVIGERFFNEYRAVNDGPGWAAMVRRHDPNLVLIPHTSYDLLNRLYRDPDWSLVEVDGVGALFLRTRPEHFALITAAKARWAALNQVGDGEESEPLAPPPPANWLRRWFTPRRFPWAAWGRGNAFYGLGLYDAARREYRRAIVENRFDDLPLVTNYAAVCFRLGRRDEARVWYRRLLSLDPESRLARDRLATLGG
jgi:Tetratricopeptide repeat